MGGKSFDHRGLRAYASLVRSYLEYRRLRKKHGGVLLDKMIATQSIFVHVPKTGGKSVMNALYGLDLHAGLGHAGVLAYKSALGWRRFDRYFKFAFVRNPWSRLYSAFCFQAKGGFGTQADRVIQERMGTNNFGIFVKQILSQQDFSDIAVFRPQSTFVCDNQGNLLLDRVCRFERIEEEFEYLQGRLCFERAPLHLNATSGAGGYIEAYDEEMIRIVGDLYKNDIQNFGYEFR